MHEWCSRMNMLPSLPPTIKKKKEQAADYRMLSVKFQFLPPKLTRKCQLLSPTLASSHCTQPTTENRQLRRQPTGAGAGSARAPEAIHRRAQAGSFRLQGWEMGWASSPPTFSTGENSTASRRPETGDGEAVSFRTRKRPPYFTSRSESEADRPPTRGSILSDWIMVMVMVMGGW
jgi:hypothetical protein